MATKLNTRQHDALKRILYTDNASGIHQSTLRSLVRQGFLNSVNEITLKGIAEVAPDAPQPVIKPEIEEARKIQDQLVALIERKGWDLSMRISRDLPEGITGLSLCRVVFPEYVSDFKRMLIQLA